MKKKIVAMIVIVAVLVVCLVPAIGFAVVDSAYYFNLDHWSGGYNLNSSDHTEITSQGWCAAGTLDYGYLTARMYYDGNQAMANALTVNNFASHVGNISSTYANQGKIGYFNFKAGPNGCNAYVVWGSCHGEPLNP